MLGELPGLAKLDEDDNLRPTQTPGSPSAPQKVTMILVMSETLPLASVKAHLSALVDRVEGEHDRVVVTRNGRPAAVLISPDDLESLEETLTILSDPELVRRIRKGEAAIGAGDAVTLEELQAQRGQA